MRDCRKTQSLRRRFKRTCPSIAKWLPANVLANCGERCESASVMLIRHAVCGGKATQRASAAVARHIESHPLQWVGLNAVNQPTLDLWRFAEARFVA